MSSFFQLNWCILVFWTRNYSLVPTYCICSVFCLCSDFILCMSMEEAEVSHLFLFIWGGIYESDPVAVKTPLFVKFICPPAFFTVSSFIKITLALLEQPYFIRMSQKRMSQTIWFYFVKFSFDLLSLVQIWTHLVQFIFNIIQTLAQALILVTLV